MPEITIDGQKLIAREGETIIRVAERNGIYIPRYCYHPALPVAGNCRMCLVEIEGIPKLQIACATEVKDGMVVYTQSDKVKKARQDVLEFLLINHPLDCPICDQVGECDLQNYYMDYGLKKSRFKLEDKNRKFKRRDIGKYLVLDNERCILCTRCVRFCETVTKTNELFINSRGDRSFIDIKPDSKIENNYSLNIADVCPVGAFTSKDFRFKKRVYMLETTSSVCLGCATGCKIKVQHHENKVYRILPEPNIFTNTWMCDYGRMTYKIVHENRLNQPYINKTYYHTDKAVRVVFDILNRKLEKKEPVSVILSSYLSIEDNLSLIYFAKKVLNTDRIYYMPLEKEQKIEDGILLNTDKTPNSKAVKTLAERYKLKKISELDTSSFVIGFYRNIKELKLNYDSVMAFSWEIDDKFEYLIPFKTYFETEGHFINWQGYMRKTSESVKASSDIWDLWKIIARISSYFSIYMPFEKKEDFAKLIENEKFDYRLEE